jgi:formiminoglutamase
LYPVFLKKKSMEDIALFFQPIAHEGNYKPETVGASIEANKESTGFPELKEPGIALIFVPDYRGAGIVLDESEGKISDLRDAYYGLYRAENWTHTCYDLGTILPGGSPADTRLAVKKTIELLVKKNIVPFLIGGTQELTFAMYEAYKSLEMMINMTVVDSVFDIGDHHGELVYDGWLSHILMDKACYLFNYSNIGAQGHYISPSSFKLFEDLYFDVSRLGEIISDTKKTEPVLRNSDLVSFDVNVIQKASFNAALKNGVNGIDSHQACRIARYAGIADKVSSIGLFNMDLRNVSNVEADLIAQLIWYFNEGYAARKGDFPKGSKKSYRKFRVAIDDFKDELIFYKSDKSSRWWMEVPYTVATGSKYQRHQLVPCNHEDYELAMKGELPDLWWKTYLKLSVG